MLSKWEAWAKDTAFIDERNEHTTVGQNIVHLSGSLQADSSELALLFLLFCLCFHAAVPKSHVRANQLRFSGRILHMMDRLSIH